MNRLILSCLLVTVCVAVAVVATSPAVDTKVNKEKKRDVNPSEMDEILADDNKKKRSQEVIMFGNQQNKPAGMVDDVLVGYADKKSFKRDHASLDDDLDESDDNANEHPGGGDDNEEEGGANKGSFDNSEPSIGLINSNTTLLAMDSRGPDSSETLEPTDDEDQSAAANAFLPGDFVRSQSAYQELDDPQSQRPGDLNYVSQDWNDFGNRFYNGDLYRRRRRNAGAASGRRNRKRSLVTPIDQLMHLRSGSRWKRDLKLRDDDVVGLLGLLAAAEVAKERQEARHRQLEQLEVAYASAMMEPESSSRRLVVDPDDLALVADNYAYYSGPEDETGVVDDDDNGDVPDIVLYEPEAAIEVKRRSGHFYPNVDYRALGVIGQRKRSMSSDFNPRRTNYGVWGRLEERKRYPVSSGASFDELLAGAPPQTGSEEDELLDDLDGGGGGGGRPENKLYSLGELLKENEPADDNYPIYRRLI